MRAGSQRTRLLEVGAKDGGADHVQRVVLQREADVSAHAQISHRHGVVPRRRSTDETVAGEARCVLPPLFCVCLFPGNASFRCNAKDVSNTSRFCVRFNQTFTRFFGETAIFFCETFTELQLNFFGFCFSVINATFIQTFFIVLSVINPTFTKREVKRR